MQGEKVVFFNIENCGEKKWYRGTGRKIKSAVSALGMFGGVKVMDRRTIVWVGGQGEQGGEL